MPSSTDAATDDRYCLSTADTAEAEGIMGWLVCDPEVQRGFKYGQSVLQSVRRWTTVVIVVLLVVIALQLTITSALLFYVRKTALNIVRMQRRSLSDIMSNISRA